MGSPITGLPIFKILGQIKIIGEDDEQASKVTVAKQYRGRRKCNRIAVFKYLENEKRQNYNARWKNALYLYSGEWLYEASYPQWDYGLSAWAIFRFCN